MSNNLLPETH